MKNAFNTQPAPQAFGNIFRMIQRWQGTLTLLLMLVATMASAQQNGLWLTSGQNRNNTRYNSNEKTITAANVANLVVKWELDTEGDVSATPTVDGSAVYFPDWGGYLTKVDRITGAVIWSHPLGYWTGVAGDFARASPAIAGNTLIIGTQARFSDPNTFNGAHVLGIDKNTGELQWMTQVDPFPFAVVTQSAVVHGDRAFVGVASMEELVASDPNYPCCFFRGSLVSLDVNTGALLWQTYMAPAGLGFSGNAVWGSTPAVDPKRNSVYIATGNNYTVPQEILDCVAAGGTPEEVRDCIMAVPGSDQNYFDAIVSLDLNTGAVKWANTVLDFDTWTVACFFGGPNCPEDAGPDYDFGQGPALYTIGQGNAKQDIVGAGQKSGIYWAVNPDNGQEIWHTQVGPGGELGGLQWGSAVDGNRVYCAVSNSNFIPWTMSTGPGAGQTVNGGFWAALDAATGQTLWEVAGDNAPGVTPAFPVPDPIANNMGPVSAINGVTFGGAMDAEGTMRAFNSATGEILWEFESGGTVISGAAISDGSVYWGSGYANFGLGTPNHKLYAFNLGTQSNFALPTNPTTGLTATGEFVLAQNQPNPFTGVTEINFEIPEDGEVTLSVYDMFGREVARLAAGTLPAGLHQARWDSGNMPAGTYTYRLVAGTFSASKLMTLVK